DDRDGAGIAHRKALAGNAAEITFPLNRTVEHRVADNDRFLRHDSGVRRGPDNDFTAREALADVIVGVAFELEGHAARKPSAETLARGAGEPDVDRVGRTALVRVAFGDLAGEHRARRPVRIADRGDDPDGRAAIERRLRVCDQLTVENVADFMILTLAIVDRHAGFGLRLVK